MPTPNYHIRTMTAQEVALSIEWAAAEGWNPGRHDARCFRAADPDGFLTGMIRKNCIRRVAGLTYAARSHDPGDRDFLGTRCKKQ